MDEARAKLQEAQDLYGRNKQWYDENVPMIEEFKRTKGKGADPNPDPNPNPRATGDPNPDRPLTRKELAEILGQTERDFLGLQAVMSDLSRAHFAMFGELLDTKALLADPEARKLGLEGVYQKVHGEKIAAKQKEAQEARDETLRKEGEQRLMARTDQINPIPGRQPSPSTLDGLRREPPKEGEAPPDVVGSAVALYRKLSTAQEGGEHVA